jgi:phosphoribosylformimino-5-aminoimidazole carboxamide ribotide isomerase
VQIRPFQIIPVIDLMHGQIVHAKLGQRNEYKPINSHLSESSEAFDVVSSLLKLYPFQTLYIADIDAILGTGNNDDIIQKLIICFSNLTIWLDAGNHHVNCKVLPVLGSESIINLQRLDQYKNPYILSLDYNAQGAMGLNELHETSTYWTDEIICRSLNMVGSSQGADYLRLGQLIKLNEKKKIPSKIYAAGGVRDIKDIQLLAAMGLSGVLLASSLHNGTIKQEDLLNFYDEKKPEHSSGS